MSEIKVIAAVDKSVPGESAAGVDRGGADGVAWLDEEISLEALKEIAASVDIPIYAGGGINDLEQAKKVLYAGAGRLCIGKAAAADKEIVKKISDRFGSSKVMVVIDLDTQKDPAGYAATMKQMGAGFLLLLAKDGYENHLPVIEAVKKSTDLPLVIRTSKVKEGARLLKETKASEIILDDLKDQTPIEIKREYANEGVNVNTFDSSMSFDEFKTNEQGLLPVVTQDCRTKEVLMVAYMNRAAFEKTVETGVMTYFSRSRKSLWIKGETSGHFQYVKSLTIDCDNDTLLAKVDQIGAACHTGNYSCFYTDIVKKEYKDEDPMKVFQSVYNVINDRKQHPKEGSYTNYLFEKGIDKILKKVGEESTEIIIAAKNPDTDEMKYEISDFLYHLMVLMVERGMTWEQIMQELMERE